VIIRNSKGPRNNFLMKQNKWFTYFLEILLYKVLGYKTIHDY